MSSHVVYRCYDAEDRLLYIGCTRDLDARLAVHECDQGNWASAELTRRMARLEYTEYPDRATARRVERESIEAEAPMLNTHHNLGRTVRDLPPVERPGFTPEQRVEVDDIMARFARAGGAA